MQPLKTHYPNVTIGILDTEPYGSEYPCELTVHWPVYDVKAVVCETACQWPSMVCANPIL